MTPTPALRADPSPLAGGGKGGGAQIVKAMLDPYNPSGSTDHVSFITSKTTLWQTNPVKCHVNFVVCDSDWEAELARVVEAHPSTLAYVKNQALGFEVPWRHGAMAQRRAHPSPARGGWLA